MGGESAKRLLLQSDDDQLRRECAARCREIGFVVEEADDSRVGLALALAHLPAAVVLVVGATQSGGFDLCRLLACSPQTRDIKVLALLQDDGRLPEAIASGAAVTLPYSAAPSELRSALHALDAPRPPDMPPMPQRPAGGRRRPSDVKTLTVHRPPANSRRVLCPDCDRPLVYRLSHVAGIEQVEQWDIYNCATGCGEFRYRHRTRTLSRTPPV